MHSPYVPLSLVMCTGMTMIICPVLTVDRQFHTFTRKTAMVQLPFTVAFLFNLVIGIFEFSVKKFAILLIVAIEFSETKHQRNKRFPFNFRP